MHPSHSDQIHQAIFEAIQQEYVEFKKLSLTEEKDFFEILYNKVHGKPLRAKFIYLMALYLADRAQGNAKTVFLERQLPFILEAIISIQYYHNQILDQKGGVKTFQDINRNLIIVNLLKEQLYRYLEGVDAPDTSAVVGRVRQIFEYVDVGQYMDKHHNTYEALQKQHFDHPFKTEAISNFVDEGCIQQVLKLIQEVHSIENAHLPFLSLYLRRIYLSNCALFRLSTELVADVLQVDETTRLQASRFATLFGMVQQIVNDNCDLVPSKFRESTVEKGCEDAFSDLRNGTITLPLLIHLNRSSHGVIKTYLNETIGKPIVPAMEHRVFLEITDELSIYYSMTIGKELKNLVLTYINGTNETYKRVKDMCGMIDNNRFYRHFYSREQQYQWFENEYKRKNR